MIKILIIFTLLVSFLSGFNIIIVNLINDHPYLYIALFLGNLIFISVISLLIKVPSDFKTLSDEHQLKNKNSVSEESISVFIKVLIYILPIIALIGLYFISVLNQDNELGIKDANSWVSFILGIAAFTMALVTLWQSEGTYNKIFTALDELKRDTNTIMVQTDMQEALRTTDFGLKKAPQIKNDEIQYSRQEPSTIQSAARSSITPGEVKNPDE